MLNINTNLGRIGDKIVMVMIGLFIVFVFLGGVAFLYPPEVNELEKLAYQYIVDDKCGFEPLASKNREVADIHYFNFILLVGFVALLFFLLVKNWRTVRSYIQNLTLNKKIFFIAFILLFILGVSLSSNSLAFKRLKKSVVKQFVSERYEYSEKYLEYQKCRDSILRGY